MLLMTVQYKILEGENLANCTVQIILPKSKSSYLVNNQLDKQCFKTEQHVVILRINSKCIDWITASQLELATQCNTHKSAQLPLSCNVSASRQPTNSSNKHQAKLQDGTTNHCPLVILYSQLNILQSHMARPYFCAGALLLIV